MYLSSLRRTLSVSLAALAIAGTLAGCGGEKKAIQEPEKPTAGQTVLYPLVTILDALHLVPAGADFFALFIGGTVYPLATLPLVLRRLHTLGRAKWEAGIVYAALLPNVIATAHTAHIFGRLALLGGDELGDIIIDEIIPISTAGDTAFIALWVLCAVLSLVGVVRLLRA